MHKQKSTTTKPMENKHTQQVDFSNPNADKITSISTTSIKQETLEEAAKEYADKISNINGTAQFDFIQGAKWQQERMYSEEELLQALNIGFTSIDETWDECVEFAKEQFKKK